jgi:glutathione S-transferase
MDKAGAWIYERRFHPPGQRNEKMLARYEAQLAGALSRLEAQTQDSRLCGPAISQAEISTACLVFHLKLNMLPAFKEGSYPRLAVLCNALEETDPFIATRPAPNEIMPAACSGGTS